MTDVIYQIVDRYLVEEAVKNISDVEQVIPDLSRGPNNACNIDWGPVRNLWADNMPVGRVYYRP